MSLALRPTSIAVLTLRDGPAFVVDVVVGEGPAVHFKGKRPGFARFKGDLLECPEFTHGGADGSPAAPQRRFGRRRPRCGLPRWSADDIGPASAKAVLCMGNGLYFSAMWEYGLASSGDERESDMEELLSPTHR
jgi:hypothetical protein